jgi:transposase
MEHYAGIDVALEQSSVCVVDGTGRIVREARVASEPEALTRFLGRLGLVVTRIGIEAGPLSQWLHAGLTKAGLEVVLLETRQVKAALSAMVVKTDRKDARGIAQLLRMGWFRPVHCKSPRAQEVRALLVGRKLLQGKLLDVELSIRGILRGFGLKVGVVSKGRFATRIRELVTGQAMLERSGRRWRSPASSPASCTGCGSTAQASASARRSPPRERLTRSKFRSRAARPAPPRSRRRDAGLVKPVIREWPRSHARTTRP